MEAFKGWSTSNFPCSFTRKITSHSMKNLNFHGLLRWKMFTLSIPHLATYAFIWLGECTFVNMIRTFGDFRLEAMRTQVGKEVGKVGDRSHYSTESLNSSHNRCQQLRIAARSLDHFGSIAGNFCGRARDSICALKSSTLLVLSPNYSHGVLSVDQEPTLGLSIFTHLLLPVIIKFDPLAVPGPT